MKLETIGHNEAGTISEERIAVRVENVDGDVLLKLEVSPPEGGLG